MLRIVSLLELYSDGVRARMVHRMTGTELISTTALAHEVGFF